LALEIIGRNLREACEASPSSIDELLARARQQQEDPPVRAFWPRLVETLRPPSPRWQAAVVTLAALAVVSFGLLGLWSRRPMAPVSAPAPAIPTALHFETGHGEQQTHRLADNSILHLNTDTAVTVRYGDKERLVVLNSGQADFEVVHAPD